MSLGRESEAVEFIEDQVAAGDSETNWRIKYIQGEIASRQNRLDDAEELLVSALVESTKARADYLYIWRIVRSLRDIMASQLSEGRDAEDLHAFRVALEVVDKPVWENRKAGSWIMLCLLWNEKYSACKDLARKYNRQRPNGFITDTDFEAVNLDVLGTSLMRQEKYSEATVYLEEAQRYTSIYGPPRNWKFHTLGLVGDCLVGLQRFEEAQELLIRAYAGMSENYNDNTRDNYDQVLMLRLDG